MVKTRKRHVENSRRHGPPTPLDVRAWRSQCPLSVMLWGTTQIRSERVRLGGANLELHGRDKRKMPSM